MKLICIYSNIILFFVLFQYRFKHLDGRDMIIKTRPGQVIEAETEDPSTGKTMPHMTVVANE